MLSQFGLLKLRKDELKLEQIRGGGGRSVECQIHSLRERKLDLVVVVGMTKTKQGCTCSSYLKASSSLTESKLTEMLVEEKGGLCAIAF